MSILVMLTLVAFWFVGAGSAEAANPDKFKVTFETVDITATEDGNYLVTFASAGFSRGAMPSLPAPESKTLKLKQGDKIPFSKQLSFTTNKFIWQLTVTPPPRIDVESRPMILKGAFPPPGYAESFTTTSEVSPKAWSSPYLESQPPSHGLEIGNTPVQMILETFQARMNACSQLPEGFIKGDYTVTVWMDGNDNEQREPNEEAKESANPEEDGKLCPSNPIKLSSFVEDVKFEYSFTDPKGEVLASAKGHYNYDTEAIGGDFSGKLVYWIGIGFDASTNTTEIKLTSPFKALLTREDKEKTKHPPTTLCRGTGTHKCPDIIGVPQPQPNPDDTATSWDNWLERFKENYAYVPIATLSVGLITLILLVWQRRRA
jgi:hypothetical protein